ncbi:MAG: cell envelope integrity EipB family protein [Hyphomicrobiales bacterium]|nr:cell envelope integrity EipB family protein [Hyphomicrobiales bacterium]
MRVSRFALFLAPLLLAATPSWAVSPLAPHRAVYDLELDKASDRSGITGLSGRMVYEFNGSPCEGYTVKFRFVTDIRTREVTRLTDQQTTTFEDGEGKNFSFVTKSFVDRNPDTETKGMAEIEGDKLVVKIEKPEPATIDLQKTQFPTKHLEELIEKAKAGETFYQTSLFDGSEDADRVMSTTVVIGKRQTPADSDPEKKVLAGLGADGFWPVDIAYFDESKNDGEETPEYRISFKLHENGMSRDLVMDYGDFSMRGTLVNLSLFPVPAETDCAK